MIRGRGRGRPGTFGRLAGRGGASGPGGQGVIPQAAAVHGEVAAAIQVLFQHATVRIPRFIQLEPLAFMDHGAIGLHGVRRFQAERLVQLAGVCYLGPRVGLARTRLTGLKNQTISDPASLGGLVKIRGRIKKGVGDFRSRMEKYPRVFERATGEHLYPGTLNVDIGSPLECREDFRIRGEEIGEPGQDLLFERCLVVGRKAYRIRPYRLADGGGGHGDHILEIVSAEELRPMLVGSENEVEIEFMR